MSKARQPGRRAFASGAAVAALASQFPRIAIGQDKTIRILATQDFTRVYTFVTSEYSQGQRDYITLINERGGINGHRIVLDVTDHGRGIEPDIIHQVFDRFDSRTQGSRHRGAGLGLSLVRSFVELHGGSVSIWSKPGEGTRVTCRFPVNGPLQTQPALTQTRDVTHA